MPRCVVHRSAPMADADAALANGTTRIGQKALLSVLCEVRWPRRVACCVLRGSACAQGGAAAAAGVRLAFRSLTLAPAAARRAAPRPRTARPARRSAACLHVAAGRRGRSRTRRSGCASRTPLYCLLPARRPPSRRATTQRADAHRHAVHAGRGARAGTAQRRSLCAMQPMACARSAAMARPSGGHAVRRSPAAAPRALASYSGMRRAGAVDLAATARTRHASLGAAVAAQARAAAPASARRVGTTAMFEVRPARDAATHPQAALRLIRPCAHPPNARFNPQGRTPNPRALVAPPFRRLCRPFARLRCACRGGTCLLRLRRGRSRERGAPERCTRHLTSARCADAPPFAALHGEGHQGGHARAGGGAPPGPQLRRHRAGAQPSHTRALLASRQALRLCPHVCLSDS